MSPFLQLTFTIGSIKDDTPRLSESVRTAKKNETLTRVQRSTEIERCQ